MAPTPSKSVQGQTTPLKTPQSKHRLHYNSIKNTHPSPNPTSAAKENPLAEHPVEVIGRIRDYPDQKDKPISGFHVSADHCTIRVQTDIGYRDFSLDGVSVSEEEDLDGFYKKFVKSRINGVKLGEKCTIMMYGPTGSGKSHTMFGCLKQPGIVYRALKDILGGSDAENDTESHDIGVGPFVQVTVLEIYNEEIYDLLSNNCGGGSGLAWPKGNSCKVKLEVMGKKAKNATFISGNEAGKISREVAKVEKRRIVKSTLCNDRSSRSHCVIILDVPTVGGRLMLVDMAGSENIEQAGQIGLEAKMQTGKINQGNIALKRVVESIANGDSHVPFRDSKLTMLLQDSFEDDKSKILMILCASPDPKEMHKTISTLEYGAKAKCIVRCGHTPNKDKVGFENSSSEVVLGSRIAAMDQFIFKLQMENKRREKERNEAHKELLRKEEEVAALRAKLEQVEERESAASEEEIDLKVKERTRVLKLELENKLQECQKMANEFVESERRRMEEKILQQQEEVEMLRQRLEEIESELCRSKENNGLQNIDEGTNFARRMLEIYGDGDRGMEKSMDLDMGDQQPTIVHDMKVVVEKETENFGNHTLFNSCVRNAMDEEDKFKEKVYLSTVFEEDEGEERESTEDEEVEKEVVEETAVQFGRRDFNKADYNSLDHSDEKSQGLGLMDELENTKDPALTRKTRIQNIFMLCGNHRELAQHVRIPTPFKKRTEAADIQSSNAPEFGLQNRVLSDVTLRNTTKNPNSGLKEIFASLVNEKKSTEQELKENTRPYDENEDGLIEVYVKWEASKEYQGKFITKLNVVKDSSLADLRKLIETRLDDENSKQGFTFLMLGEPTGAPVMKEKEAIVQASKLPICNNQLGVHLACLRPIKAAQQPNHHFPFSPLENKLQVASNSPSTFMKKIEGFSPKLGQNLSPTPYVTTGLLYR